MEVTAAQTPKAWSTRDADISVITLSSIQNRNAIDEAMVTDLHAALDKVAFPPAVLLVVSAVDGVFAAGAHLGELRDRGLADVLQRTNVSLFERIRHHRWPTIAVVDGPAVGAGAELALACDLRVASPSASFRFPEVRLGVIAGAGGVARLPEIVGLGFARRMLYTGELVSAARAAECGLVDEISPDPLSAARELASSIATNSWSALEFTKLVLSNASSNNAAVDLGVASQAALFAANEKAARIDDYKARRKES